MSLIISMKRSHWTILTRLGIYNVVMSLSGKNYLKIRLTTQQLSFLISNILCKIVVNDLLNNQNILKDIFEDKRGQCQKWWRREKVEIRLEFFESLNGTTDFLLWNSEQGTREWLVFFVIRNFIEIQFLFILYWCVMERSHLKYYMNNECLHEKGIYFALKL